MVVVVVVVSVVGVTWGGDETTIPCILIYILAGNAINHAVYNTVAGRVHLQAVDVLMDDKKRKEYDIKLREAERPRAPPPPPPPSASSSASAGASTGASWEFYDEGFAPDTVPMHCPRCDGVHAAKHVNVPLARARYCGQCKAYHAAKDDDVWVWQDPDAFLFAEKRMYFCKQVRFVLLEC